MGYVQSIITSHRLALFLLVHYLLRLLQLYTYLLLAEFQASQETESKTSGLSMVSIKQSLSNASHEHTTVWEACCAAGTGRQELLLQSGHLSKSP